MMTHIFALIASILCLISNGMPNVRYETGCVVEIEYNQNDTYSMVIEGDNTGINYKVNDSEVPFAFDSNVIMCFDTNGTVDEIDDTITGVISFHEFN